MALVVLLRGVNVGGRRSFRPTALAGQLKHLDAVNIGAAGTLVIRQPISQAVLRAEVARRLPFETSIIICRGNDFTRVLARDHFAGERREPGMVRFMSILAGHPREAVSLPVCYPPEGKWLLKILARDGRFVLGAYRRHMKVIGYLGKLDRLFKVPVTTRSWNTIDAIAEVLAR